MWEDQIHAATVDIEMFAQILFTHSRTFAVPSGEMCIRDRNKVVLNEEAVRLLGYPSPEEALGKQLEMEVLELSLIHISPSRKGITSSCTGMGDS